MVAVLRPTSMPSDTRTMSCEKSMLVRPRRLSHIETSSSTSKLIAL
jgi:hypothetical protein